MFAAETIVVARRERDEKKEREKLLLLQGRLFLPEPAGLKVQK